MRKFKLNEEQEYRVAETVKAVGYESYAIFSVSKETGIIEILGHKDGKCFFTKTSKPMVKYCAQCGKNWEDSRESGVCWNCGCDVYKEVR